MRPRRAHALLVPLLAGACMHGEEEVRPETGGNARRGEALMFTYGCGGCHIIPGVTNATGLVGPPLDRWAERQWIAGAIRNEPPHLVRWIVDPQAIEPGTAMPNLGVTVDEAGDMAAYLYTLGDPRPLGPPHLLPLAWLKGIGHWSAPKQ